MSVDALVTGIEKMGLSIDPKAIAQLHQYVLLLAKWSKVYNLTTIRDVDKIIPLHILDSLSLLPYINDCKNILDVGAGAGLPGIPIAICRPDIAVTLLDAQQKKVTFMQHVITTLQLTNARATHERIEKLQVSYHFDMVVSRAFASCDEFVKLIAHLCLPQTKIVAMKAKQDVVVQEVQALPQGFELVNIEKVDVPGVSAERCLVFLKKI